ncbi:MAG: cytochrome c [Nitrospira sp.]|nr:cytochrome c [Nitrospira sp.]
MRANRVLRYVTGYLTVQGGRFSLLRTVDERTVRDTSADRGQVLYKEYCAQCHGGGKRRRSGRIGLGPEAGDPCQHSFDKVPTDYLYNVINHGGAALGNRQHALLGPDDRATGCRGCHGLFEGHLQRRSRSGAGSRKR